MKQFTAAAAARIARGEAILALRETGLTLRAVAAEFGVTQTRISQLLASAIVRREQRNAATVRKDRQDDPRDLKIDDLPVSARLGNVLRNEGYKTLGEVIEVPEWHLLHMQNFGRVTLKELRELVAEHGLRMAFPLEMQPGKVIQVYGISVRKIGTNVIVAVKVADEWRDVIVVKDADSFSHILEPGAIKEAYRRARDASGR